MSDGDSTRVIQVHLHNTARVALVDVTLFHKVAGLRWCADGRGYACATARGSDGKVRRLLMHRVLMDAAKGQIVDHKNGDPLDNRMNNLRFCTHAENMRNRKQQASKSGVKGIRYENRPKGKGAMRLRAQVICNGRRIRKAFPNSVKGMAAAIEWLKRTRRELHGEFARDA